MASRPYLNHRGQDLLAVFKGGREDAKTLKTLRAELAHRNTPSMRDLRTQVDEALAQLEAAPAMPPATRPVLGSQRQAELPLDTGGAPPPDRHSTPSRSPKSAVTRRELPSSAADGDGTDDPIGAIRGKVGSIRPCGPISGVPSRWVFPDKRDFEIEVGKNASRVEKFVATLRALVKDMRRRGSGMRTVTLEHGEAIALDGRERGYRFPYDGDAELFEGAKVTIAIGNRTCDGRIVSVSIQWLVVSFDEDLGPTIGTCVLRIDNTAMIDALADRLDKVRSGEAKLNLSLADDVLDNREAQISATTIKNPPKSDHKLNAQQLEFVEQSIANPVTYLWGPPGTGKTRSLSTLNEFLFDAGKRVLICSNTNQAVDQVLLNLCNTLTTTHPALDNGRVLRIGKTDGIPAEFREFVTLDGIVRRKSVDLQRRKKLLEEEIQRLRLSTDAAHRILNAFKSLDEAERERQELVHQRAARTKVVADAETAEREGSKSAANLERELAERIAAGVMRRLLMRSEAAIRADLTRANAQKVESATRLRSHRLALEDPAQLAKEREVAVRHGKLTAALRDQNRVIAKRQVDEAEEKIAPTLREISDINKSLEEIEKSVVAEARIIGATVTKTYLTPQQFTNFDVVIVDEASMVMLPAVYYVSGLAKEKVIVSGDFRQLSPIVPTEQAAIQEVIGSDVFQAAGITEAVKAQRKPKRTVMLTDQYRMNEAICHMISGRMYAGRLKTQINSRIQTHAPPSPFSGSLTVIDTSPIQPFVNRHGSSRYNLMNALAVRNLVRHFQKTGFAVTENTDSDDQGRLGICTPFAAQRDVLKRLTSGSGVIVGTVHRYQGDEKLAMIIDVPDSLGERYVSLFAQAGSPEDSGTKLFNVAVSRAKEHVIFVANLNYLDAKLPADAFLRDLLHEASAKGRIIDVRDVLAMWPIADDLKRIGRPFELDPETLRSGLFRQVDFEAVCGADIERATKGIAIYSGFVTPQRVAAYEALFRRKLAEGVKIRCVTRPPTRNGSIPPDLGRDALDGLEAMGCVVDTRWDIHEKIVIIDDEIIWFGSLNPLSHNNRTDEMMARVIGKPAALQLSAFMAVTTSVSPDKADGLSVVGENPRCPDCGHRTTYRLGSYGPFWQCEDDCGWKQNAGRQNNSKTAAAGAETLPKAGAPCPVCSGPTALRHGPHGHFYGCANYPACKGIVREVGRSNGTSKTRYKPTVRPHR
jgi:ssDNA-binding Zn-finger/Zn-ribbon topoisomerase 1